MFNKLAVFDRLLRKSFFLEVLLRFPPPFPPFTLKNMFNDYIDIILVYILKIKLPFGVILVIFVVVVSFISVLYDIMVGYSGDFGLLCISCL